jgi:hypothetical protein
MAKMDKSYLKDEDARTPLLYAAKGEYEASCRFKKGSRVARPESPKPSVTVFTPSSWFSREHTALNEPAESKKLDREPILILYKGSN